MNINNLITEKKEFIKILENTGTSEEYIAGMRNVLYDLEYIVDKYYTDANDLINLMGMSVDKLLDSLPLPEAEKWNNIIASIGEMYILIKKAETLFK